MIAMSITILATAEARRSRVNAEERDRVVDARHVDEVATGYHRHGLAPIINNDLL